MENYLQTATSVSGTGWNFYTFLKYSVPGIFTALWIVIFGIRAAHLPGTLNPIDTDAKLLTFLHVNWAGFIGIVIALGGFVGVMLVGVDPIIRAFMGSRGLSFVFKNLLSSKPVDFAYFQFMRLHDVNSRYERLPRKMIERGIIDPAKFNNLVEGDYSSRYLFRENIQNYFWQQCLDSRVRSDLMQRWEQSSMFLYLSFSSLLLFVFQVSFYAKHLYSITMGGPNNMFELTDIVPFVLLGYVIVTGAYNAYHGSKNRGMATPKEKTKEREGFKRKALVITSFVAFVAFCIVFHIKIQTLTWLDSIDVFLFSFFFLAFVSFYWSGAFQFSRYVIDFDHYFRQNESKISNFAEQNLELMEEMDAEYSRGDTQGKTRLDNSDTFLLSCMSCGSKSFNGYSCSRCARVFCNHCAAHSRHKCQYCGTRLTRIGDKFKPT